MNCQVAADLVLELDAKGSRGARLRRRPVSFRYWAWYLLPVAMLAAVLAVPAASELDPRDVATAMLGGQIGYLGFLFAIVTFVADTGVLSGTRGVRRLTESTLPYFVVVLVGTGATAVCVINPSEMYARIIVCSALVIAMLLPVVVIRLGKRAAPDFVASQIRKELVPVFQRHDTDLFRHVIHEDLNDLRAAAILLWNRGDLEGYKTLVNAFLDSIPYREVDVEFPQFRFLSMWIEMQSEQPAGLLFIADQAVDEILVRLRSGDANVAARLLRFVTDTVAHILAGSVHGEYRLHALRVIEVAAHKVSHIGSTPPQRVRGYFEELSTVIESFLRDGTSDRGMATQAQAHETLFSLALLVGSWPCGTAGCDHSTCGSRRRELPARVVLGMTRHGLTPSRQMVERLRHDVFTNERVDSSEDERVRLLGALIPCIDLLRTGGDNESARQLLEIVTGGLPVDRIDTGSARYLNKCLEALQLRAEGTQFWNDVVLRRTSYIAASNKDKDIREHLQDLLRLGMVPGVDHSTVGNKIEECVSVIMRLKSVSTRKRVETLRLLVRAHPREHGRRAELRAQLLEILGRLVRPEGHAPGSRIDDDVRMVSHLLIGMLWAEENNGERVRDPLLGDIATSLKQRILGEEPPDAVVVQEILHLGEKLSRSLTSLGARVNALKFVDMSLAAATLLGSVSEGQKSHGVVNPRTVAGLSGCVRLALELPRNAKPPAEQEIALDSVRNVIDHGGTVEESLWCAVLAAQWIRRTLGRRVPDSRDRQRLADLIAEAGKGCSSIGERALLLGAQKSVALLLSVGVDDRGEQFESRSRELGKLLDEYKDEHVTMADRVGILDAYRMVALAEREHGRHLAAARTGGRALSVAGWHVRRNLSRYVSGGSTDTGECDSLIGTVSRTVEELTQDLVRVDPRVHLVARGEGQEAGSTGASTGGTLNPGRVALLGVAVEGVNDFLRCLSKVVTRHPRGNDDVERLGNLRILLVSLAGDVFVAVDMLDRMLDDAFSQDSSNGRRELAPLRGRLRALIGFIEALSGNNLVDSPWERGKQLGFPLSVSIAAATSRFVATMVTATFSQLPKNLKSYLENRGQPQLERYLVTLLKEPGRVNRRSREFSGLDDHQRRQVVQSVDVMTEAVLNDLTTVKSDDGGLSVAKEDQVTALWHCENSLRVRQVLGVHDRYVHYGVTYMLLVAERLGDDRLPKGAPELIFGDIETDRARDWSVFSHVMESGEGEVRGPGAAGSVPFRNAALSLVQSLLEDPDRRHVSSKVRVRLEELWTHSPGDSEMRRLLGDLLRLWNPYFTEFPPGGGERLLPADAAHAEWMALAAREW